VLVYLDYAGLGVFAGAFLTGVAAVTSAVFAGLALLRSSQNSTAIEAVHEQIATNGDPRSIGEITTDIGAAVAPHDPPPGPGPADGH